MAERVSVAVPQIPTSASCRNGRPAAGSVLAGFGGYLAHLLGAQLPQVLYQSHGKQEHPAGAAVTEMHVRHFVSQNARAVVAAMVPWGRTSATGSVKFNGAETRETLEVRQPDTIATRADMDEVLCWVKPVTGGALTSHSFELTNVRPGAVVIYEVPRTLLSGALYHVDSSIGHTHRYISDDAVANNPRGFKSLLDRVHDARVGMRRHLINSAWPFTTGGSAGGIALNTGYLFGSATAGDGLRVRARDIIGDGATEMPAKMSWYIADAGASTFTFTVTCGGAGSPYTLAGVNAAGWTAELDLAVDVTLDTVKVEVTRTAGAGNLRVATCTCYEAAP